MPDNDPNAGVRPLLVVLASALLALALVGLATASPADSREYPTRVGWNVNCFYAGSEKADPIVSYGRESSHLHDFFGVDVDRDSTRTSLLGQETNCRLGNDHSGYWTPALYKYGKKVPALRANAYYRAAPRVNPAAVKPFPLGLKIVAGQHDATAADPQPLRVVRWTCDGAGNRVTTRQLPFDCSRAPGTKKAAVQVTFPDCARSSERRYQADSLDHQSHMAYSRSGRCPATHPRHVPMLRLHIVYDLANGYGARLAGGGERAYSMHADFMEAWERSGTRGFDYLLTRCTKSMRFCGAVEG